MHSDIVEELFKRYYNDALLYTLMLCKNRATAEDIVSTAFYKALTTADGKVQNFKAWLFAVCRNLFYNHHRRDKRHVELTERQADEREAVLDRIIADERYLALYRAIDLLPEAQREVVTLFYFEEMRLVDIAELIGKTATNTKVILYRARESIKKILEE